MWAALWVLNFRLESLVVLFLDRLSAITAAVLEIRGRCTIGILQDRYASRMC